MGETVLIWLSCTNKNEIEQFISENQMTELVDDIRIFDDVDECIDNLPTIYEERGFLRLGRGFSYLPAILNDFKQIHYIYPSEPSEYKDRWRMRHVCFDDVQFVNQLKKDVNYWSNHYGYLTYSDVHAQRMEQSVSTDIQYHACRSVWSQFLLEILLKMPPSTHSKKDFLDEARHFYRNNRITLSAIDQFEREYHSGLAIQWYTRDSFLYRLVNKALRTRDISLIFKFRFIIQDIYKQLKDQHQKQSKDFRFPMKLYRGQLMTKSEFDQLEQNPQQLISINTFLSTTTDEQLAVGFSSKDFFDSQLISILFEISIDRTCDLSSCPPFAGIHELSYMREGDEKEYLLSMGTVMQVTSIRKIDSSSATVYLRMCQYDEPTVDQMKRYLSMEMSVFQPSEPTESFFIFCLGRILDMMGHRKKANQMYGMASMDENSLENTLKESYKSVSEWLEDLSNGMDIFEDQSGLLKLRDAAENLLSHPALPDSYRPPFRAFLNLQQPVFNQFSTNTNLNMDQMAEPLENVMQMIFSSLPPSFELPSYHPLCAHIHNSMGTLAFLRGQHDEAKAHFDKALTTCQTTSGVNNPINKLLLYCQAMIYIKMDEDARAEEIMKQMSESEATSQSDHLVWTISAKLFQKRGNQQAAIDCYQKVLRYLEPLSNWDEKISHNQNIGFLLFELKDFHGAQKSFQTALDLLLEHQSWNHSGINSMRRFVDYFDQINNRHRSKNGSND